MDYKREKDWIIREGCMDIEMGGAEIMEREGAWIIEEEVGCL